MAVQHHLRQSRLSATSAALLVALCAACPASAKDKNPPPPVLAPAARIAVAPLGFLPPNPSYLQLRLAWSSLNFIDNDHLLFTFHVNELLRRSPDDQRSDNDQMIRAVVLNIATGKAERTAEWRMYDRGRYLWGLRNGQFLVRRRNALYLTDSTLALRPYLMFDTDLQGVQVSPERTMLLLEIKKVSQVPQAEADGSRQVPTLLGGGGARPIQKVSTEMLLLQPQEHKVLAKAELRTPKPVPLMEDGVVGTMNGDNPRQWILQEQTIQNKMENFGTVMSDCTPQVQVLSRTVVLALGCSSSDQYSNVVAALKLGGKLLWQSKWSSRYIWPSFDYAENGSRFAYESLQANRDIGEMDSFGEADIVAQPVGVFDTDTGKLVLVEDADPIMSEGQNFALSADGRRFAIVRGGAIEVYNLPPVEAASSAAPATKQKQ